jgi:hypothetical protein
MKQFPSIIFAVLICFFFIQSCSLKDNSKDQEPKEPTETISPKVQPGFVHAVYFWLKKDNPELVADFMSVGLPKLAQVPSIQSVSWGPPAGSPRDVVDNSYDLAWIVNFANAEKEEEYQVDPLHVEFVEKYKSIFEKVQVYDNTVGHYVAK